MQSYHIFRKLISILFHSKLNIKEKKVELIAPVQSGYPLTKFFCFVISCLFLKKKQDRHKTIS